MDTQEEVNELLEKTDSLSKESDILEEDLAKENKTLEATLESVGDGVISFDNNGKVLYLNKVAEFLTGWELKEAKGKNIEEIFNVINELTREKIHEIEYVSYHDLLTGLYNRRFYEEEVKRLDTERNLPISIIMGDVNGLKLINDSFGHIIGDNLLKKVSESIKAGCRGGEIIARLGGDEFVVLLPKTSRAEALKIIDRIQEITTKEKLDPVEVSISFGCGTKVTAEEDIEEIFKKAEDHMYQQKLFESPNMKLKTINVIIRTLQEKNLDIGFESERISELCSIMGDAIGLSEHKIALLKKMSRFHDIGKIAIEEYIFRKPDKLTELEREEVNRHSEIGYRILSTVNDLAEMAEYVLYHHERWNGKGYPKGLKAEEIPIESRILAIIDAYEAMITKRSYREPLTENEVLHELQKNAGTQFDPELVFIFIKKILEKRGKDGYGF